MNQKYFDFNSWKDCLGLSELPESMLCDMFLLDTKNNLIYLSQRLAQAIPAKTSETEGRITIDQFIDSFTTTSKEIFLQDINRLCKGSTAKTDSHYNFVCQDKMTNILIVMVAIKQKGMILGMCHINFDLMHEYENQLEQVINQLKQAECINQLILEGSTDYIYHFDIVNNICTFSPKALDVLPLEHHTFGNAMDTMLSFIIPEDRDVFLKSFSPFLTGKTQYHTAEYRVNTKQNTIMWISCHGKGLHDDRGNPIMIAGSLMDITEQKKNDEKIQNMLIYDEMTGLKNTYCFQKEIDQLIKNEDMTGSVLSIDICNFKVFNQIFGYSFANKILKEFAQMLKLYISDNLGIYRMEGDKFLVHIKENSPHTILERLAPLKMCLSKPRVLEGHTIYIGVHIGIAIYPEHGNTSEELLKNANTALYMHTKYNSQQMVFFRNETNNLLSKKYQLENVLRHDINDDMRNFKIVYQPVMKYENGKAVCIGAEALLRYSNSEYPGISQSELIETLEYSSLIINVGRWVLEQAIKECARWHKIGFDGYININIAAQQVSDAGLVGYIKDCCEKAGLKPKWLTCELTETSLINNLEIATQFCEGVMKLGAGIALDDFGTGYSSFNYLRSLPISQIKVDREYTLHLNSDPYNQIIIKCLYDLSQTLGLKLCVEGVETEETMKLLLDMGITFMQGFYFDKPLEADVFFNDIQNRLLSDNISAKN